MKIEIKNNKIADARIFVQEASPGFPVPAKSYFILMIPRTGSNLLSKQLKKIRFGNPIEAFHFSQHQIKKDLGPEVDISDPIVHLSEAIKFQSIDGNFGMKIRWLQLSVFLNCARQIIEPSGIKLTDKEIFEVFFPSALFLYMRRRDKVKQAVSFSKAMQTGLWMEKVGEDQTYKQYILPPVYDRAHIEGCLDKLLAYDISWKNYLANNDIDYLELWYEHLASNYLESMKQVYEFLGIDKTEIPEPALKKQANIKSQDWGRRFINETPWIQDTAISETLRSGDLTAAFIQRSTMIIHKKEQDRFYSMPATRFKSVRNFLFRVKRKLSSIFSS